MLEILAVYELLELRGGIAKPMAAELIKQEPKHNEIVLHHFKNKNVTS